MEMQQVFLYVTVTWCYKITNHFWKRFPFQIRQQIIELIVGRKTSFNNVKQAQDAPILEYLHYQILVFVEFEA